MVLYGAEQHKSTQLTASAHLPDTDGPKGNVSSTSNNRFSTRTLHSTIVITNRRQSWTHSQQKAVSKPIPVHPDRQPRRTN